MSVDIYTKRPPRFAATCSSSRASSGASYVYAMGIVAGVKGYSRRTTPCSFGERKSAPKHQ